MNTIPTVNYSEHASFSEWKSEQSTIELSRHLSKLDEHMENVRCLDTGSFLATITAINQELSNVRLPEVDFWSRTRNAVNAACNAMLAKVAWQSARIESPSLDRMRGVEEMIRQFQDEGAAYTFLPDSAITRLYEMLCAERQVTRKRHEAAVGNRYSMPLKLEGPAWDLTWKLLSDSGVIAATSFELGREVQPLYWALSLNTSDERWYKDCYADDGIPTSKLAYLHYDHDFDLAKIQIYLSDVTMQNGPFSFHPGSHKWDGCRAQQFYFKEMDKAFAGVANSRGGI